MIGEHMKKRTLTFQQIYREGTSKLKEAGIREAALDAWYLLEFATGITKASYYGNPDKEIKEEEAARYLAYIESRKKRIPLQHITKEQAFMGYLFYVDEHVLIPRQDTETLAEEALKVLKPGMEVLDLCTGSGCILISLMKMCEGLYGTGSDISEEALEVARKNACRLEVNATFIRSSLFEHISGRYDLIVSNPPYIRTSVIQELQEEVRLHDPFIALDGKEDGLYFYREIIKAGIRYLRPEGYLMFEIGYDQGTEVASLMEKHGYRNIMVKKDLAGLDRVVSGMYNGE